jgi:hypothetical protein
MIYRQKRFFCFKKYISKNIRLNQIHFNLLQPTSYVMHQQFNIQQLYPLPTLYLCVLYLSENEKRLLPTTAWTDWFL